MIPQARPAQHPLGPLMTIEPLAAPVVGRLYAGGLAAAALAVLVIAARLTPDPQSVGTHRQLGLPPCGFLVMTGLPCPTCGMTTSFALAVRGHVLASMRAQIAGFALAAATVAVAVLALFAVVTGRRVSINWYRVNPTRLIWLATLGFLVAWGLKIGLEMMNRSTRVS